MEKVEFLEILAMVAKTEEESEKDEEPEKEKKKRGRKPGTKNKATSREPKRRTSRCTGTRKTDVVALVPPEDADSTVDRMKKEPKNAKKAKKA